MKKYTLTTKAYGKEAGDTISLNPDDALVQLNIDAGVLVEGDKSKSVEPERMTCPLCADDLEMKRPPKFDDADALAEHYQDKHPAFAVPAWTADEKE